MTKNEFQQCITLAESEILDFKQEGYDLEQKKGRNALTKDVLAMANTPREQPARIVFGVDWTPESKGVVVGLKRQLDDVDLQNAFRRYRIHPIPEFVYTPFEFKGMQVGILEIPVSDHGPCTPLIDLDEIRAGTIYYRSGTKNTIAVGITIKHIVNWFQDKYIDIYENTEMNSWHQFFNTVRSFEQRSTYLLAVDRITLNEAPIYALGMVPWRAVVDFDPDSEDSGFLHYVSGTLKHHRVIHRIVRGQYQIHPEPGIHWFFSRGLSGREGTMVKGNDHKDWLKSYKKELGKQLNQIASAISPSPVVVLVLWSDINLRNYLRTFLEELHGAFGNSVEMVVISEDEQSFRGLVEEQGASFVRISLRSLCHGVQNHYADLHRENGERYILPSLYGAPVEVKSNDLRWISEGLDLIHKSIGLHGDDDPLKYRSGADISWRNLQLHHDCDRDITAMIRSQVETDLRKRQIVRINIYHSPGSGGTTVGQRVAWDLHNTFPVGILRKCTPKDAAVKIEKITALTESSVLVVVDGGQHSDREIDDLYELLKARQTPVVLLQILRRFKQQTSGRRQFWLDAELTDEEADRFCRAYSTAVPEKRKQLTRLASRRNDLQRSAFFFGLTAYGSNFRGLRRYIRDRIVELTDEQCRILVYVAIAHYYGQQSIPAQAFGSILHLPSSRTVQFSSAFADKARQSLDLLTENKHSEWRTAHHLIALEIMQQNLAPQDSQEPGNVWRQKLSMWGKSFIDFCQADELPVSDRLLELIRRVFIYRDNNEMIGTERAAQNQFAQFIEDVPSFHGKIEILNHLTKCFPMEAHFHAHMGRLLSQNNEHNNAMKCIDCALSLQSDDHVLHHMKGMVSRQRMKEEVEKNVPVEQLIDTVKEATESFEEARRLHPDLAHSYISEVQMLIHLVDKIAKNQRDIVTDVLTRPNADPFLKRSLEKAEDLLDQVDHLYAGEPPNSYVQSCRARLQGFYGNFQRALQAWDSLLSRPDVAKPPIRRQIVWTILRRHRGDWRNVSNREKDRIRRLLEDNMLEDARDSTSLRLWIRAIRYTTTPPSLDLIIEKISYWKTNTGVLEAAYYLYVLHMLRAISGSTQGAADAERALDECRMLARFRRDRTRSFEWLGSGTGISALVHQSRLGSWAESFWESTDALVRINGRISNIDAPQKGFVELSGGIKAFFVPAKSGFQSGRDENVLVHFYLGFSYDGLRAWDVRPVE